MKERPEDFASNRSFGKWSEPDVPHRGWYCVAEFDAKEETGDLVTCEMCERSQVRFVHVMENHRYDTRLNCGCVCAGHMANDVKAADDREQAMRSKARRRVNFPKRKGWKISAKGNSYLKSDGVHVVIARKRTGQFQIGIKNVWEEDFQWGGLRYENVEEAKTAAFAPYDKLRMK
ncbi:hypothetical protein [Nisaea sp.]